MFIEERIALLESKVAELERRLTPVKTENDGGVSAQTLSLIKKWEGFRANAYQDPVGVWTIGYGTTRINGKPVTRGMTITQEEAENILRQQVATFQKTVVDLVTVPLNANQLSALVSFTYNLGIQAFSTSTMRKKLNAGDYQGAAQEFDRWVYAGGKVLAGLVSRRAEERRLFVRPV